VKHEPASRAFTLIEMLVALAIISTIMTMVYGSYAATSRSLDIYHSRMACGERASLVLRLMARQLRCAHMPSSQKRPAQQKNEATTQTAVVFRANPSPAGGEILSFDTAAGLGTGSDQPMALSRVTYRYDPSSRTLAVCSEPCVQRSSGLQGPKPWRTVLGGVTGVDMEFRDGQRWQSGWDTRDGARLPQAVRVALTIVDESGRVHTYRTGVPIGCRTATQKPPSDPPTGRL